MGDESETSHVEPGDPEPANAQPKNKPRTWNPNENMIWPVWPRDTRLPIRELPRWKSAIGALCVLVMFAVMAACVWGLFHVVHSHH